MSIFWHYFIFLFFNLELHVVRELTLAKAEGRLQVRNEISILGSNSKDFLVKSLLVSSFGFRESSLLLQYYLVYLL
jgi:hypothetical protein